MKKTRSAFLYNFAACTITLVILAGICYFNYYFTEFRAQEKDAIIAVLRAEIAKKDLLIEVLKKKEKLPQPQHTWGGMQSSSGGFIGPMPVHYSLDEKTYTSSWPKFKNKGYIIEQLDSAR